MQEIGVSNMEQRIGYKVITKDRYSALIEDLAAIQYPVQKTVKPKDNCGPICVFRTAIQAKTFVNHFSRYNRYLLIVKCRYEESDSKSIWTVTTPPASAPLWCLPVGTILADSVTCLE